MYGGHCKLEKPGIVNWIKSIDKSLTTASCAVCGMKGMAYSDSKTNPKPHYCFQHLKGDGI